LTLGHIEPYLQQLSNFDAVVIEQLRAAQKLSEHIAISSLQRGMLRGKNDDEIRALIRPFIDPTITMSHGRALNHEQVKSCGLTVDLMDLQGDLWKAVWDLYMRGKYLVDTTSVCKLVETVDDCYTVTGE